MTAPIEPDANHPLAWAPLQAALLGRQAVHVSYHGRQRLIYPHALGWKNHRAMVLGYQIGGQTTTGTLDPDPRKRWRCLFVDEIEFVATDQCATWQTADNYNPERPFHAIDEVAVALSTDTARPLSAQLRSRRNS
jgi:hypothetical protein